MLQHSEACERNKDPILDVLRETLKETESVLEIGSGTAQHAVYFARFMPQLTWQPSELEAGIPAIEARLGLERGENVKAPIVLDVAEQPWPVAPVDAVFSANCLHIMSWPEVEMFFSGLETVLQSDGLLCVYGPFNYNNEYTSASNERFDQHLRQRDPENGIRDIEQIQALARAQSLTLEADYAMPANNRLLIWRKKAGTGVQTDTETTSHNVRGNTF